MVDQTNAAVQALRVTGQTLSEVFNYTMRDTAGATSASTLTITVDGRNDTPVANTDSATAIEAGGLANATPGANATGNVLGNDTDVDSVANGESKTVTTTGVTAGTYGTLTLNADGSFTYVVDQTNAAVQALRNAGQTVAETFNYTMRDKAGATSASTLVVSIRGANDLPVAVADTLVATEDTALNGSLASNDIPSGDGGNVWTRISDARHGTVVVNVDGSFTYTPSANYNGPDSFAYTITDVDGDISIATVRITVLPVNDPPLAVNDSGQSPEGGPVTVKALVNDTDVDGDALTISKIAGTPVAAGNTVKIAEGEVTLNTDGILTFAPNPGVQGNVVFSYEISDGHGGTAVANVSISVVPAAVVWPSPPTALLAPPQLSPAPGILTQIAPLSGGEQAREPSVFFDGAIFNRILRLPIPFHPGAFINGVVEEFQQAHARTDALNFSDPNAVRNDDIQSQSISAGLGQDTSIFVRDAVRGSQTQGEFLNNLVNGRHSRVNLSSDREIPTPELFQPGIFESAPVREVAADAQPSIDALKEKLASGIDKSTPIRRTAQSFSEQLRGSGNRTSIATREILRTRTIL